MDTWVITLIIIVVLGFIIGNIMLLKHTAHMKIPESVLQELEKRKKEDKKSH